MIRSPHLISCLVFALALAPGRGIAQKDQVRVDAQPVSNSANETYRLRIENALYGRVEVSVDQGAHYTLLGRVLQPATGVTPDRAATTSGTVLRSSTEGIAFSIAAQFAVKIRPSLAIAEHAHSKSAAAEIVTSVAAGTGIFGKALPPAASMVLLQPAAHAPGGFPENYSINAGDAYVISVNLPATAGTGAKPSGSSEIGRAVKAEFDAIAAAYKQSEIQRATAEKRKVASGTLTLRPNLPPDEPDPITAVTYAIDENVVCARTTAPYLFPWDTTAVSDDEHVIEVRALSASGVVITKTRYLVVVRNHGS